MSTTPSSERDASPVAIGGAAIDAPTAALLRDIKTFLAVEGTESDIDGIRTQMLVAAGLPASIVVVGEVSRGKSTLVNALIGRPGLSPVGVAETTGAYLNFVAPTPELPLGQARLEFLGSRTTSISPTALADWVVIGAPALEQSEEEPPIGASIAVEASTLPGVTIVDTPGAGGLNENYTRLAISRAQRASILLLVTDVGAPLTTHALTFLSACASHVEAVVIAVNKIDKSRDWRPRLEDNRVVLSTDARLHDVDIVGVSGADATTAIESPREDIRELAHSASNIDELVETLHRRLDRADKLPAVNALRSAHSLLLPVRDRLIADTRALQGGEEVAREFDDKQKQLESLLEQKQYYRYDWSGALDSLQLEMETQIEQRFESFASEWAARIAGKRFGVRGSVVQSMNLDIVAELAVIESDLRQSMTERLTETITALYATAGIQPTVAIAAGDPAVATPSDDAVLNRPMNLEVGMLLQGWAGYNITHALAGTVLAGVLGVMAPVVPFVGAAALLGATTWSRELQRRKQGLQEFVRQVQARSTKHLFREYRERVGRVRSLVIKDFEMQLTRLINETREQAATARRVKTESEQQRADQRSQLEHRMTELQRLAAATSGHIARLLA